MAEWMWLLEFELVFLTPKYWIMRWQPYTLQRMEARLLDACPKGPKLLNMQHSLFFALG
jgi:hypothetical protein